MVDSVSVNRLSKTRERYETLAATYGQNASLAEFRRQFHDLMKLNPGETVLDVGCGTGLNFTFIQQAIGPSGRLIGIELTPAMLAKARQKVAEAGWQNVELIDSSAEEFRLRTSADAAVIFFSHPIMISEQAIENIVRHVKPGGRVMAVGNKWGPWWDWRVILATFRVARRYRMSLRGLRKPWNTLERHVRGVQTTLIPPGKGYFCHSYFVNGVV